jgi:hypothetical protein
VTAILSLLTTAGGVTAKSDGIILLVKIGTKTTGRRIEGKARAATVIDSIVMTVIVKITERTAARGGRLGAGVGVEIELTVWSYVPSFVRLTL